MMSLNTMNILTAVTSSVESIISDVGATFEIGGLGASVIFFLCVLITLFLFFPISILMMLIMGFLQRFSPKNVLLIVIGSFLTAGFALAMMVTLRVSFDVQEVDADSVPYGVWFNNAAEDTFGENVDFYTVDDAESSEPKNRAWLPPESYDPDNEVYSGMMRVVDISSSEITTYDVVISLDGTVTFTEMVSEESANSVNGGEQ